MIADIKTGGGKPTNLGIFLEYGVLQEELFVLVGMMGGPFAQPLH